MYDVVAPVLILRAHLSSHRSRSLSLAPIACRYCVVRRFGRKRTDRHDLVGRPLGPQREEGGETRDRLERQRPRRH